MDDYTPSPAMRTALVKIDWTFGQDRAEAMASVRTLTGDALRGFIDYAERTLARDEAIQRRRETEGYSAAFPAMARQQRELLDAQLAEVAEMKMWLAGGAA